MIYFKNKYLLLFLHIVFFFLLIFLAGASDGKTIENIDGPIACL